MESTVFDDLVSRYSRRQISRRQFVRRALGVGFGATGLAGIASVLPATSRRAAASQSSLDPPPGWPPYLPWPWGPGPTFPREVPEETARKTGIAWYVGGIDSGAGSGYVVGLTRKGREVRRYEFRQSGPGELTYALTDDTTKFEGSMTIERLKGGGIHAYGNHDSQRYDLVGSRDGEITVKEAAKLEPAKAYLLAEYQAIGEAMVRIGETLKGMPAVPQASCGGCVITLGGLGAWGAGCGLSTAVGLALVCGGGWLAAVGTWVNNCEGACAD
jgi:hypothetical protein